MKKENRIVWTDGDRELLVAKPNGKFNIPIADASVDTLRQLGEAIKEALEGEARGQVRFDPIGENEGQLTITPAPAA